jgi:hypothetical protein
MALLVLKTSFLHFDGLSFDKKRKRKMPSISLFVISPEETQTFKVNEINKRIFISDASPDLYEKLENVNDDNEISVLVNGIFELVIDDPKVIRREAQKTDMQSDDFVSLYSFLSSWPYETVEFEW